jgi:hypothetical protein
MVKNIWALISLQNCKIKGRGKIIYKIINLLCRECDRFVLKLSVFDFIRMKKE